MGFLLFLFASPSPAAGASTGNEFTITKWSNMGAVAITVCHFLDMSVYSIANHGRRYLTYTAAKAVREFARASPRL